MTKRKLQLSVVIPTLGRPIIVQTLQSLVDAQRFDELEVFVAGHIEDHDVRQRVAELVAAHPQIHHLDISFEVGDSSEKKNAGAKASSAEIIAFLDDDVVVAKDWPAKICEPFEDPEVGLVSGPSLIPDNISVITRMSGLALASGAAGYVAWRYRKGVQHPREVGWSNIIGCNAAYRRSTFDDIGGFDPLFWPGEEMLASHEAEKKGHKLVFHPEAYVYHYPRSSLARFCRQIFGYGATRIRLIRAGVAFEPSTAVPAVWVLSLLVLGLGACGSTVMLNLLLLNLTLYGIVALFITIMTFSETWKKEDLCLLIFVPVMHLSYGLGEWYEFFRPGKDLGETPYGRKKD